MSIVNMLGFFEKLLIEEREPRVLQVCSQLDGMPSFQAICNPTCPSVSQMKHSLTPVDAEELTGGMVQRSQFLTVVADRCPLLSTKVGSVIVVCVAHVPILCTPLWEE